MTVRRLAPDDVQPKSFAFSADNLAWLDDFITHFPPGRQSSAVIPALMRAQDQEGWVTRAAIEWVADKLGMARIRVLEVATFYTQFQLAPVGRKAHIQVCGTTPCLLRGGDEIIRVCKDRIHHDPFHLSADGDFSWEEVECLGACVNAPMVAVGKDTYEDLTPESFSAVLDGLAVGKPPKPGPQNGRTGVVPEGGPTTLTDPGIYNGAYRRNIAEELPPPPEAAAAAAAPVPAPAVAAPPPPAAPAALKAATAPAAVAAATSPAPEAPVDDAFKPELLTAAKDGKADDLSLIRGVGPKLVELLNGLGVYHFAQIAAWSDDNLRWIDQHLGAFKGRAVRDKWIEQAKQLATGWRPSNKDGDKPA
jgi:NADH-quinone oxidoreductase subunit E